MSTEQNKEISLGLIEALNVRDPSLWSRHLSEDYAAEHPGVSVLLDKTGSIAYHQRFVTAFPDIRFEVQGLLAEGVRVSSSGRAAAPKPNGWPPSRGGPSPHPAEREGGRRDAYRGE